MHAAVEYIFVEGPVFSWRHLRFFVAPIFARL